MYSSKIVIRGRQALNPYWKVSCACACHKRYVTMTVNTVLMPLNQCRYSEHNVYTTEDVKRRGLGVKWLHGGYHSVSSRTFSRESLAQYMSVDCAPISMAYETLNYVHSATGLPWWGAIAVTTFTLRALVTLPLAVYSSRVLAKVECLQPEIAQLAKDLKGEVAMAVHKFKWSNSMAKYQFNVNLRRHIRALYIRDNCHPFKASVLVWVQLPLWICLSLALRNMAGALPLLGHKCQILNPELATEGTLWFSNMLIPDATLALPVLVAVLNLANVEIHSLRTENPSRFSRIITNVLRGVSVLMIPIGASVPSCMCFYWACSSLFSLGQNLVLKMPRVRGVLPIPRTPNQSDTPFRDMYRIAKIKYL